MIEPNSVPFWHRTPPALFPSLLGFLGLGLSWRAATDLWAVPSWLGEGILALAVALFTFTFACYLAKLSRRPSVIFDDLKVGPARGAVSAGSMCLMLVAAALTPYSMGVAKGIWIISVGLHFVYLACVIRSLAQSPAILPSIIPPIFLPFVGVIVAAASGPALGFAGLSQVFIIITIPAFIFIAWQSLRNLKSAELPLPLRSSYFIFLAPVSVYGIAAQGLWSQSVFTILWWVAIGVAVIQFSCVKWFVKGGWNPGWGAFTFPLSSFAAIMILGAQHGFGPIATIIAGLALVLASIAVPYIVWKTYRFWADGKLAQATGAAIV